MLRTIELVLFLLLMLDLTLISAMHRFRTIRKLYGGVTRERIRDGRESS